MWTTTADQNRHTKVVEYLLISITSKDWYTSYLWENKANSWTVTKLAPVCKNGLRLRGIRAQCQGYGQMFLLGLVRILQCSGEMQGAEPGVLRKVRLASPSSPRAWQSLNHWQTEMQEGLALWFNQEALARKHNRVLPAGTGLIEMCLHYTPFLANWNQNNFKMLTFEWRQEACGCVFGLTGIRTWWGSEEVCSPGTSLLPLLEESVQRKERLSCLNYLLSKTKQKSVCSSENQEHLSHGSTFSPLQPCWQQRVPSLRGKLGHQILAWPTSWVFIVLISSLAL